MTMTDGEREIVKQLKRIADALGVNPDEETSFADTVKRFAEVPKASGGYVGGQSHGDVLPIPFDNSYILPKSAIKKFRAGDLPTESSNEVWERLMRQGGEGDHLLNPDADHSGEDLDG